MEILDVTALDGPNHWAAVPVFVARICIVEDAAATKRDAAVGRERRLAWLRDLARRAENTSTLAAQHRLSAAAVLNLYEQQPGDGTEAAASIQYLSQILQMIAGVDARYGDTRPTAVAGVFECAFQFEVQSLARACLECAVEIWSAAERGAEFDFDAALRTLVNLADDVRLGPSTRAIVEAAAQRGIPSRRLTSGSLVMLGEGKQQRRICTAETDATSAIAERIARDKDLTKRLLHAAGIPVPQGRLVRSGDEAWQVACEIGTPVAIKPSRANHAEGVSLNLSTRAEIAAAYAFAQSVRDAESPVLVEQFIRGDAHRLLIVGNRLVAAARGEKEFLIGDGARTIRQLIDQVNCDPRRGENYTDPLTPLELDTPALLELERQSLTPDSIPAAEQRVLLHRVGDYTTDCTDDVHPETAAQAALAARLIGLDIAGIDLVAENIGQPLAEQRGAILEVNAGPSLGMHVAPLRGKPRPVGAAIVAQLFPAHVTGRIGVFVVTGNGERSANAQWLERQLIATTHVVGRAEPRGLFVTGRRIAPPHRGDFENAEAILLHPDVEIAVIEVGGQEAVERGLGCSRADVAIVASGKERAGDSRADAVDWPPPVIAAIHAVPPDGFAVLPWNDAARSVLAPACRGSVFYYSFAGQADGGDSTTGVFFVRGGDLVLSRSCSEETRSLAAMIPSVTGDPAAFLPALCGLWLAGLLPARSAFK